jgi:RluA family pseudouridine synthase
VDGRTVTRAGEEVGEGANVAWDPNRRARPRARLDLPLLHADDALLVIDKPAGLLAVPTAPGRDEDCAARRVERYVRRIRTRHPYVGLVHRLDRDTSGALAFALDPPTRQALRELFRAHRVERRYLALVAGAPRQPTGEVELPIRDAYRAGRRAVARPDEPSRPALTRFRVLERFAGAALLEVELHTGRQHQIRIHLAHIGLPVLGDAVYGGEAAALVKVPRQMLHAQILGLAHPASGEALRVASPTPPDFERVLAALRARERRAPRGSR